jgi:hypothetical protein
MGRALQPAPAGHPVAIHYERRQPEETTLYQVVQEQLETFLAQVEAKTGTVFPSCGARCMDESGAHPSHACWSALVLYVGFVENRVSSLGRKPALDYLR